MAQNSKITRIAYWDDRSAWVSRGNDQPHRVYKNLTVATRLRLEKLSWKSVYQITISLIAGIAIFISRRLA